MPDPLDSCGVCTLIPSTSGRVRAVQMSCPVHGQVEVPTVFEHDSDVWETVSGWIFGCRTCLEHQVYGAESAAMARKRVHDSRELPWWVKHFDQEVARG